MPEQKKITKFYNELGCFRLLLFLLNDGIHLHMAHASAVPFDLAALGPILCIYLEKINSRIK